MDSLTISNVLFTPHSWDETRLPRIQAVGLVVNANQVFWGDVLERPSLRHVESGGLTSTDLHTAVTQALVGQSLASFNWQSAVKWLDAVDFASLPGMRIGVEQALIAAVAKTTGTTTAEVMTTCFTNAGLSEPQPMQLILEVENHQATAQLIESMIALDPDGVGYRLSVGNVIESIGPDAQYLQRFVRELGVVLAPQTIAPPKPTTIYLGLNGSLGTLTADPRRDSGRVLGNCFGLESAAGSNELWLEDPVVLEDEIAQAAMLRQLRENMRARGMRSKLIGRSYATSLDGLQLLWDTDAVDGVCLQTEEWGSLSALANGLKILDTAQKLTILAISHLCGRAGLEFYLDFASTLGISYVLVGAGWGGGVAANEARAYLDRRTVWLNFIGRDAA